MTVSVNTNQGAFLALQNLTKTNKQLEFTQFRVTTGLRVNGPKDDAATFAIANTLRGDIAGNNALKIALANGESVTNVAIEAGRAISDLLIEMKAKVVQANQAGLDANSRTALQNDYDALRLQIKTIVATAEFNGVNLIKTAATDLAVLSTVDGSTITVTAQDLSVTALGISAGRDSDRFHHAADRHPEGRRGQPGRCQPRRGKREPDLVTDQAAAWRTGLGDRQRRSAEPTRALPVAGFWFKSCGPPIADWSLSLDTLTGVRHNPQTMCG